MSKLRAHNVGIGSALWPATVCGRKKTGTEISCSGRRFGQRFGSLHAPKPRSLFGRSQSWVHRGIHHKHSSEKQRKHLYAVVSDPLSIHCFFSPGKRPRRQTWESHLHPTPASSHHHHRRAQVNKHTHTYSTSRRGRALPPLQSALISSSVCAAEDNLEAMACSRTHCLSHTAIKCTSLSGCPVSLGQEGLSSS